MTREEEIKEQAKAYTLSVFGELDDFSDATDGFVEGAKWADKTMIEKIRKWIESTDIDMEYWNPEEGVCKELLIEGIKKAMEL